MRKYDDVAQRQHRIGPGFTWRKRWTWLCNGHGPKSVLVSRAAFILTRPLGATVGDFLDKPLNQGGLALSRPIASAVIAGIMIGCILLLPQRAGRHPAGGRADASV